MSVNEDNTATPLERVLDCLQHVRRQGSGWSARCPAHLDRRNSLSVAEGEDGRVLVHCFAGCTPEDVVAGLGLEMRDLFPPKDAGGRDLPRRHATVQGSPGCTLDEYAAAKQLPVEFLETVGLTEITYASRPAVKIPYADEDGAEIAVRFRIALEGDDRFRWKNGSKPRLYGLNRLGQARELGYVVLVEGESDVHTLWHHGYPALGLPGATLWSEERDAPVLSGLPAIYVVIEPDAGGEAVLNWLRASSIRERVRLVRLQAAGDVSELHLRFSKEAPGQIEAALQAARPWSEHEWIERELARRGSWEQCAALAQKADILGLLGDELEASGLVGEARTAKLLFLALTSRLLEKPVSVAVKGPSAGGKSYSLERVLELFPPHAFYELTAMSERALAYGTEPLAHRFLIIFEAAGLEGDFASYLVRSLLSEGRLRYETVEKTDHGLQTRVVERAGPTGLIVTTTAVSLHPENETRMLSIPVTDTAEQTRKILLALAEGRREFETGNWRALQAWLETGDTRVVIPFVRALAELIPPVAVRLRRDFRLLISLIEAHTLLCQASRARTEHGAVVATLDDYGTVRELVHDLVAEGVEATVSSTTRETVEAVARLAAAAPEGVSVAQLSVELNIDKASPSRRVTAARTRGYLKNLEERRGRRARLVLDQPLPVELELLPDPATLSAYLDSDGQCTVAADRAGQAPPPVSGARGETDSQSPSAEEAE